MSTVAETLFAPLTIATAPDSSRPILENIKKANGFVPNLMAIFANNPTVLQGYLALDGVYEKGSFTPRERQLILLAASVENHCNYCAAAHSHDRKGCAPHTGRDCRCDPQQHNGSRREINAVVTLVKELVRERGYAREETIQKFIEAGYRKEQVMELLLGIALKTISNYLDHISPAPVDPAFAAENK